MAHPPPPAPARTTTTRLPRPMLLRCIAMIVLSLIVLVGLAVLIVWLTVRPRKMVYSIDHASINHFNLTNDHLNSNFHFTLRAYNPNRKVAIYYDKIEATLLFEDQKLAVNNIHPFFQRRHNVTFVDFDLAAKDVSLFGAVARDMKMEKYSGDIDLDVRVRAKIRYKVGVWKSGHHKLKLLCGPMTVPFSSAKEFQRTPCDVDL